MANEQYLKELNSLVTFRVKTSSKFTHIRKRNKLMRLNIFGGYERINENEFYIYSKIGMS